MTSSFQDIFSLFLSSVEDYDFINLSEADFEEVMTEYLQRGISMPHLRNAFNVLKLDKYNEQIEWELKNSIDEDSDSAFVEEVIVKSILCKWLNKHVYTHNVLKQFIGTSKEKYYSQSSHLSQMRDLQKDTEHDLRYMVSTYGYLNTQMN